MTNALFKTFFFASLVCAVSVAPACSATVRAELKSPASRIPAPPFGLANAAGKTEQLTDYRGKVVLLNFWATDCGGCRLEIPWIVGIDQSYKNKGVAVVGISMDISYEDLKNAAEAWSKVKPFIQAHQITYPILMGDAQVTKSYDLQALPATYLIDKSGRVAAAYIGLIDKQNVEANINTLLAEMSK